MIEYVIIGHLKLAADSQTVWRSCRRSHVLFLLVRYNQSVGQTSLDSWNKAHYRPPACALYRRCSRWKIEIPKWRHLRPRQAPTTTSYTTTSRSTSAIMSRAMWRVEFRRSSRLSFWNDSKLIVTMLALPVSVCYRAVVSFDFDNE